MFNIVGSITFGILALAILPECRYHAGLVHNLAAVDSHHAGLRTYRRGEHIAVLDCADRAALHWQDAPATSRGPGLVAHLRGLGRRIEGNKASAIDSFFEALGHARNLSKVSRDVAIFLADLGDAELSSGDRALAERDLREALRISLLVGDRQVTAGSLIRLARAVLAGGNSLEAKTLSREALSLSEEIGRQEFIADSCDVLAQSLLPDGGISDALLCARRAVDLYHRLDSPKAEDAAKTLRACGE